MVLTTCLERWNIPFYYRFVTTLLSTSRSNTTSHGGESKIWECEGHFLPTLEGSSHDGRELKISSKWRLVTPLANQSNHVSFQWNPPSSNPPRDIQDAIGETGMTWNTPRIVGSNQDPPFSEDPARGLAVYWTSFGWVGIWGNDPTFDLIYSLILFEMGGENDNLVIFNSFNSEFFVKGFQR